MNEFENKVYTYVKRLYSEPEWIALPQVRTFTGYKNVGYGGERYIDIFIINTFPSKNFKCIAIEIKKTIEDFRKDIVEPEKQLAAKFYSDEFYYLFPKEIIDKHKGELFKIKYAGILSIDNIGISTEWGAPKNTKSPFPMGFICSLLRNAKAR